MNRTVSKIGKWTLRIALVVLILFGLQLAVLAFPYPMFPNKLEYANYTFYCDQQLDSAYVNIAAEVQARNEAVGIGRPDYDYDIFICKNRKLYKFLATLTRKNPNSMGLCLTAFGNIYISEPRVREVRQVNGGMFVHSFLAGELAGAIGHEIMHLNSKLALGFWDNASLPFWKSEGYAEYGANRYTVAGDADYSFRDRVARLYDDNYWYGSSVIARRMYRSHMLVEFLSDIKGYRFEDIMADSVDEVAVMKELQQWYDSQ